MDSGNSGSLQSSSCGADEQDYDSRAVADDSMFMSTTTSVNTHPPPHLLFDPFSNYNNYMQVLHHNNNSSSSSSLVHTNNYTGNWPTPGTLGSDPNHHITNPPSNFQQRPAAGEDMSGGGGGVGPTRKKRSRASRRAPTTVLTTDTTNFRAMVQEFTGIPAPPFSTSNNSFQPTRLDLFRSAAPPYLRRPFPHKPHHDSSSTSTTSTTPAPINNNYQQLPIFSTNTDHFNNNILAPPINTNPNTSFLFTNSLVTTSKPQFQTQPSNYDVITGALPSLISSDQISSAHATHHNHPGSATNWAAVNNNNNTNSDGVINGHDRVKLNGGDDSRSNIDNIIAMTRGGSSQGMVESWICSSD